MKKYYWLIAGLLVGLITVMMAFVIAQFAGGGLVNQLIIVAVYTVLIYVISLGEKQVK